MIARCDLRRAKKIKARAGLSFGNFSHRCGCHRRRTSKLLRGSLGTMPYKSFGSAFGGSGFFSGGGSAACLRSTASGSKPCTATTRDCISLTQAQERSRLAQSYAQTGNVLLGIGLALAVIGAALFVLDLSFVSN